MRDEDSGRQATHHPATAEAAKRCEARADPGATEARDADCADRVHGSARSNDGSPQRCLSPRAPRLALIGRQGRFVCERATHDSGRDETRASAEDGNPAYGASANRRETSHNVWAASNRSASEAAHEFDSDCRREDRRGPQRRAHRAVLDLGA